MLQALTTCHSGHRWSIDSHAWTKWLRQYRPPGLHDRIDNTRRQTIDTTPTESITDTTPAESITDNAIALEIKTARVR
ncbi:hypothetical protein ElyMa_000293600 [Elysia marginata]|uniref:Uncharacterized protein n=1 Tax=Elysia marginata TaxID=1093978 RepID=A0AAV4F737_9GAST|nr:hypothetical protein ElyMa_000293600 [Elysia marginata]